MAWAIRDVRHCLYKMYDVDMLMQCPEAGKALQHQLLRIQELCNNLYSPGRRPVPFWIDTLCVPHERELRQAIIREMGAIYERAHKVLVLDSNLLGISIGEELREPLMHIICSGWCQRLWTLQEGFHARKLFYQFLNGTIKHGDIGKLRLEEEIELLQSDLKHMISTSTLDEDFERIMKDWINRATDVAKKGSYTDWSEDLELGTDQLFAIASGRMLRFHQGPRVEWDSHSDELEPSSVAIACLQWRQTSKPQDEVFCLASLLGVEKSLNFSQSAESQMKEIMLACNRMSPSMLFGDHPRSQEVGFR